MKGKKIRVGIFASSDSLRRRLEILAPTLNRNYEISIDDQGLEQSIPIGKKMQKEGVEVIISRRGTAHLLRENLDIPVISFPQSTLSILQSLEQASHIDSKILLPCFRNPLSSLDILEKLLSVSVTHDIYHDMKSLDQIVKTAMENGFKVAVGGSVTRKLADNHGLKFIEIETSEEEIQATLETACSAALSNRQQLTTAQQYLSIINAASDGIVAVDQKGHITTVNRSACGFFNIDAQDVVDRPITRYLPNSPIHMVLKSGTPVVDRIEKISFGQYVSNYYPITMDGEVIGAVSTFKEIEKVMESENKVRQALTKGFTAKYHITDLIHQSQQMADVITMASQFAKTESTILLTGETGTGKEIIAQSIHNLSHRASGPCVTVNCAALPEQLLESELFGYEGGAFTGSRKGGKPGVFELAHDGTIFLDEIDSTPLEVQVRLLRVLQEREVRRVGGDRKIPVNVRVITASGNDLSRSVHERRFREDLFFRLNVLKIAIPPLRERRADIPILLNFFSKEICATHGLHPIDLPQDYLNRLVAYSWPGNVRQLRNFAERLVLNCHLGCTEDALEILYRELLSFLPQTSQRLNIDTESKSSAGFVPPYSSGNVQSSSPGGFYSHSTHDAILDPNIELAKNVQSHATNPELQNTNTRPDLKKMMVSQKASSEAAIIQQALEETRFSRTAAAKKLGMSRTTLWRKIKMYNIL